MSHSDVVVPEFYASEQRIAKIKAEIDQFEQKLNRVSSGLGTTQYLNEEYHNLILSTRDLTAHLAGIQKASETTDRDPDLRARAHNLNFQAVSQLRRIQTLGMRVEQLIRSRPPTAPGADFNAAKLARPLEGIIAEEPGRLQTQQITSPAQLQLEDEKHAHEMEQLQSDIGQVNELFLTVATMVHEQGAMVDSIDKNVEVAYEKVEKGVVHLDNAVQHRKSARRKKLICISVVLFVIVILGLIIGLSVR